MKSPLCWAMAGVLVMLAGPAVAQPSRPSDTPPAALFDRDKPTSKSDGDRLVGKVLEIDSQAGAFKLETDEGVVIAKPKPELLRAARVGDVVSVQRPENDAASASPRIVPRTVPRQK